MQSIYEQALSGANEITGDMYNPSGCTPLFADAFSLPNVHLPQPFWDVLNYKYKSDLAYKIAVVRPHPPGPETPGLAF